eukprot:2109643-Rhodomonas_salina.1
MSVCLCLCLFLSLSLPTPPLPSSSPTPTTQRTCPRGVRYRARACAGLQQGLTVDQCVVLRKGLTVDQDGHVAASPFLFAGTSVQVRLTFDL